MSWTLQVEKVNRVVSIPGTQRDTQELFTTAVARHLSEGTRQAAVARKLKAEYN